MKNVSRIILVIGVIIGGWAWHSHNQSIEVIEVVEVIEVENSTHTKLMVKNMSNDSIQVYLTLGGGAGYIHSVSGIFGITNNQSLQGSFYLSANDSVMYDNPTPISGNISFGIAPSNCTSVNLFEFCLNNASLDSVAPNQMESVDISCMSGVNVYGSMELKGGGGYWTDNHKDTNATKIVNNAKYHNSNISGIFPYGCPNCINTTGKQACQTPTATPNTYNICLIQRNATESGGVVIINYLQMLNN